MKKLAIIAGTVIAVFVVLLVFKNFIIKTAVEKGTQRITGLELDIGTMDVGLLASRINIMDMRLLNPPEFPDKVMFNISKLLVDVELASFFKQRAHVEMLELNLKELMVVRNKEGKLNLAALQSVGERMKKRGKPADQKEVKKEKKPLQVTIDTLILGIGKVTYKDYAWGKTPLTKTFNIGIHEVYRDITDPKKLVNLIIVRALQRTDIAQLANFDLGTLKADVSDTLQKRVSAATEAGQKELESTQEEAVKQAEEEATKNLKKLLENE